MKFITEFIIFLKLLFKPYEHIQRIMIFDKEGGLYRPWYAELALEIKDKPVSVCIILICSILIIVVMIK